MRVIRKPEAASLHRAVVTLGNFDGVHRGHQAILRRVVDQARAVGGDSVAITFHPHPTAVLAPDKAPPEILSLRQRLMLLREIGLSVILLQRFTPAFARLAPEEFIEGVIVRGLGAVKVVVGHSVSFGRGRAGNAETLRAAGERSGFAVEVVGPVVVDGVTVSSTIVRKTLAAGDVAFAARLLGRTYGVDGRVVAGDRRGKGLGFPTANVRPEVPLIVPDGVYAVVVEYGRARVAGVANVGRNPTFGADRPRTLEAHLFDFDGDLYGRRLRVLLVERLRGELRFADPAALVDQIRKDVERARAILATAQ